MMLPLDNHPKIFTIRDDILSILQTYSYEKLVVDMGCGHGDYMIEHCPEDTSVLWVGIEISRKRAIKTERKLLQEGIDNFVIFADNGQDILASMPENCINMIHINFPDPWLQNRHWKNRLFRPSFVVDMLRVLKIGGQLSFVTDIREYADSIVGILSQYPCWDSLYDPAVQENIYTKFPTLFYKKMHELRPISYVLFQKNK